MFVYIIVYSPENATASLAETHQGNKETTADAALRPGPQIAHFKLTSTM